MNKQEAIRRLIKEKFNVLTKKEIAKVRALFNARKKKKST